MTIKDDDWRLRGQEKYMMNMKFHFATYPVDEDETEHDHCEFCWQKIGYGNDAIKEGYVSSDNYRWVCENCFSDFKEKFNFKDESKSYNRF